MKNDIYHTAGMIPKSNRNIRETGVKLIPVAHRYMPIYITCLK